MPHPNPPNQATGTSFERITPQHVAALQALVGESAVHVAEDVLEIHSHDWTEDLRFRPEVVVQPRTPQATAALLAYCHEHTLPVTPAGARTGLSGGMLPVYGGVLLSLEKLNRIVEVDTRNLQLTAEAGAIVQHIQDAAAEKGLMYPPDPSSKGSCTIGGNIAENAGGAHAVKYGITKDYVLNLQVATPQGELFWTGANVLKNSTGYNLTQLMVGSEGTLGVVTQAVLKLVPAVPHNAVMLVPFRVAEDACRAVSAVFQAGIVPSALEFMEADAIRHAQDHLNIYPYDLTDVAAHLLVEVDGHDLEPILATCADVAAILAEYGGGEALFADSPDKKADLWRLRRSIGEAVKSGGNMYKEEDTVVPRAELANVLAYVKELGHAYGFRSVCYGHAGDGNLHVNILRDDLDDPTWNETIPGAIVKLFQRVIELGGTLSGEHGLGWVQKRYVPLALHGPGLSLRKAIKQVFDPKGILNPGKIFPDEA